jgi:hypothetical protein
MFARDKLVLTSKAPNTREHLTVHFGPSSRVLDIHKTRIAADGSRTYQTVFRITHDNLARMFEELAAAVFAGLMSAVRPLAPYYMVRSHYGAIVGPLPTQTNLGAALEMRKRRLTINDKELAKAYRVPRYLDELYELKEGEVFILMSHAKRLKPRRVGFGFPVPGKRNRRRLIWIPDKLLQKQVDQLGEVLKAASTRFGVAPFEQEIAANRSGQIDAK